MKKVFIDGKAGTTGLRIYERLKTREDVSLILLSEEERKDEQARKEAIAESDITFLCLPDAAAVTAAELAEGTDTVILDASTAHRTKEGWVYGFPELCKGQRSKIAAAKRIAVPGCHASGFIALIAPLIQSGLLAADTPLSCFSLTGYSGGGKKMIAEYEAADRPAAYDAPRQYGLTQQHKHLREMVHVTGLQKEPFFAPVVAPFYSGMSVMIPLFAEMVQAADPAGAIRQLYQDVYTGPIVRYRANCDEDGFYSAGIYSGFDNMEISVSGNDARISLHARYDNLGKGASGAAIQCMNLVMGADESTGLQLKAL